MLTAEDEDRLRRRGHLWDHCWRFYSLLAGEPFLIEDCLVHFDGTNLYFDGFTLSGDAPKDIDQCLVRAAAAYEPNLVWYSGPSAATVEDLPGGLTTRMVADPDPDNVAMEIDLTNFSLESEPRRRAWIRNGKRRGYRIVESPNGVFTHKHILLLENWLDAHDVGPFARSTMARIGDFARLPEAALLDVFCEDELLGFGVMETCFKRCDVFIYGFSSFESPGVSDYLHWGLINAAVERGKGTLSLGYSIDKSLRQFKAKWGAVPSNQGFYDRLWYRDSSSYNNGYCHWPNRVLHPTTR